MMLFKVMHKYKLEGRMERKGIGSYSTEDNARNAVEELKQKPGFCDTQEGFVIKKVFRLFKPKLMDKTFWVDGFVTMYYRWVRMAGWCKEKALRLAPSPRSIVTLSEAARWAGRARRSRFGCLSP